MPPLNIPQHTVEGQGLSKKQTADLRLMEKNALAWTTSNGRAYEDASFPATAASLGAELAQHVKSWRRPSEFSARPELFKNFWEIEGVKPSSVLGHRWFLGALNIVAGNKDNVDRLFLSALKDEGAKEKMRPLAEQGAREGFYIVRFYRDDPNSDDDWECVLVDDRIPCGADGKPAFASCADENVFWVNIVEKAYAKYCGGYHKIGVREVEYGLELLCGGVASEPIELWRSEQRAQMPGGATPDALWQLLCEKIYTNHALGAEWASRPDPSRPAQPRGESFGINADQPYCIVTANEFRGAGKMLKMRTFRGDSEWSGKWSDGSEMWTNQLRQLLSYSSDADDGAFFMDYADFCKYFNRIWTVRMADDQWTRFNVRSEWRDRTAGGSSAYVSWVQNYQWRLRVPPTSKPARVFITVSAGEVPQLKALPADGAAGEGKEEGGGVVLSYTNAIGLDIFRGYRGDDRRRQRMDTGRNGDALVFRAEPQFRRKIVAEVLLEPAEEAYILCPYLASPGAESAFSMVVLSDDKDDDGKPDFEFDFISEPDNWKITRLLDEWAADSAGGPLSGSTWDVNSQFQLVIKESRTRVWLLLELVDADVDGRNEAGIQTLFDNYPTVQLAVLQGRGKNIKLSSAEPPAVLFGARSKAPYPDGLILELPEDALPQSDTPYVLVPFAMEPGLRHKFAISVFASREVDFSKIVPQPCDLCPSGGECTSCPMVQIMRRLDALETRFDNHLSFLEKL